MGFHHVMLVVGVWPVLLHLATDLWAGLRPVNRDIQDRLYSRFAYICTKVQTVRHRYFIEKNRRVFVHSLSETNLILSEFVVYSAPVVTAVFLAYTIPAYFLFVLTSKN